MSLTRAKNGIELASSSVKDILDGNDQIPMLRKQVQVMSEEPGVYRWLDKDGTVLYVGKAKNLKNRLKSYVSPAEDVSLGPWKRSMLRSIAGLEVTVTNSELEALVLETNLIKEIKPKYNVLMKDDKNYVYIRIAVKNPVPDVTVVRKMQDDGAVYFGPYLKAFETKRMLECVHTVFPFQLSKETVATLNKRAKDGEDLNTSIYEIPPLGVQIGKHCGLGAGTYTYEQYMQALDELRNFLRGDRKNTVLHLQEQMKEAAMEKKFEKAAKLRDALLYIESLEEKQVVSDTTGENTDYIGIAIHRSYSQVVLMKVRDGRLIAEQSFEFKGESDDAEEVMESFISQFYTDNPDIPDIVVIGTPISNKDLFEQWLATQRGVQVEVRLPERGRKMQLLDLAMKNAEEKVKQQEATWESAQRTIEMALGELQELLSLPEPPKRIEGYDISHLSGSETVGSMVVTKNGKAANDQYRSFTIKTLDDGEIDDYASLKEVLRRRLLYLSKDIKEEELRLQREGITVAKARKAEQKFIEETIENQCQLTPNDISYKDFLVARNEETIVGFARLVFEDKVQEIKSLWVDESQRGKKLGQTIVKKLLTKTKGKVYVIIDDQSALEEYYAEIGFRHIHSPPDALLKKSKMHCKKAKVDSVKILVYIHADHKKDSSLNSRPDLLVIDGGKGQLSTVHEVLQKLDLDIPVIGLAKREEEVFVPGDSFPVIFPKDSQAKFMLMRLRNEAHRFANRLREKKGLKKIIHSALDDVSGIGAVTKKQLLKEFGSVSGIKSASDEQLLSIVNAKQLQQLRSVL